MYCAISFAPVGRRGRGRCPRPRRCACRASASLEVAQLADDVGRHVGGGDFLGGDGVEQRLGVGGARRPACSTASRFSAASSVAYSAEDRRPASSDRRRRPGRAGPRRAGRRRRRACCSSGGSSLVAARRAARPARPAARPASAFGVGQRRAQRGERRRDRRRSRPAASACVADLGVVAGCQLGERVRPAGRHRHLPPALRAPSLMPRRNVSCIAGVVAPCQRVDEQRRAPSACRRARCAGP